MAKKDPVQVSLSDSKRKKKKNHAGDMSFSSSVKSACGQEAKAKPNSCTWKIPTGLRRGKGGGGRR